MSRRILNREKYESGSKWFCDWHRDQPDNNAKMIDLDGCGYCHKCSQPIYLIEATEQRLARKSSTVTEKLGAPCRFCGLGGLEVFVFYRDNDLHPGKFLVDHRSAGSILGWIPVAEAWEILQSLRRSHVCDTK